MSKLNVNPTRMELRRLKNRLKTATRGHKLLKDKSDEMIRQFMLYVRENKRLREEVEEELGDSLKSFMLARAVSSDAVIEEAIAMPSAKYALLCKMLIEEKEFSFKKSKILFLYLI